MISADQSAVSVTQFYGEHHGWLVGWLRKKVSCPHHAADLAHDTFVRIIGARDLLYLNEPQAYLTTTARRLMIDQVRRRQIEQAYLAELALTTEKPESSPSPEQTLAAIQALQQIGAALDGLAEKPRQGVRLRNGAGRGVAGGHLAEEAVGRAKSGGLRRLRLCRASDRE